MRERNFSWKFSRKEFGKYSAGFLTSGITGEILTGILTLAVDRVTDIQ